MGPLWTAMNTRQRQPANELSRRDVPQAPGVDAWYHDDEPVYAGRALGTSGLRGRVWANHLATGADLSRSSFRRNVCEHLAIAPTSTTRIRPSVMKESEVAAVNEWVRSCEFAWTVCGTSDEASRLERELLAEWKPPLSRR